MVTQSTVTEYMKDTAERIVAGMRDIGIGLRLKAPGGQHWPVCGFVELYFMPEQGVAVNRVLANLRQIQISAGIADATIRQGNDRLIVQIPYGERQRVTVESLLDAKRPPYTALCGMDMYGTIIGHNFADPGSYHCIVAGSTGSGKTVLAHSMVMSLAHQHRRSELALVVYNPKVDDEPWLYGAISKNMPWDTARTTDEAVAQLRQVVARMQKTAAPVSRIIVYVEEVADLAMNGGQEAVALLTRIAQRGGTAGIHLIACTQKPKSAIMDSLLTANIPTRYVGKVDSATTSANICGAGVGAHQLRGKGDFFKVGGEKVIRLQCAIPDKYVSGMANVLPTLDNKTGQGASTSFSFPTLSAPKPVAPSAVSALRDAWNRAGEEDRRLIVAEHILANAIKADVGLGDARGQLSKSMFVRVVAGRALAGNLVEGGLSKLYDAATSTHTSTSTATPENPPPPS